MVYAYVRVSSKEQNEDRQLLFMRETTVPEQNIFIDKQSGKDFDRKEYQRLICVLQPNDILYITSIYVWVEIMKRFWSNGGY